LTGRRLTAKYLYRGVNAGMHESNAGRLEPNAPGESFKTHTHWGGDNYWGDGSVFGESETNAVILHQFDSNKHRTSGVSTTPDFESAKRYATHDGQHKSGVVYKIEAAPFKKHHITAYQVDQHVAKPAKPEDQEVILVAGDFGTLPDQIVIGVIKVP